MKLEELQRHWQAFGEQDPLWAILSSTGKRGGGWELEEFLQTGRTDVQHVFNALEAGGIAVDRGRALDFGCGVGRLTQALALHFTECEGVDLAASMIAGAEAINPNPGSVRFHHNGRQDLRMFADESFDFVLSLLVLQHMNPTLMRGYLREFIRVLRPEGKAYFNIPERWLIPPELPADAYRASIASSGELPVFTAGQVSAVGVAVRNESRTAWPASAQLQVGDHWRTTTGELITLDDGRARIDDEVQPGEDRLIALEVRAPESPGRYVLEIDLMQEWITWFADRGSRTLSVTVSVEHRLAPAEPAPGVPEPVPHTEGAGLVPTMEMHVMSRAEVLAAVEEAGGVVLEAMPGAGSVPSHPTLDYVVARRQSSHRSRPGGRQPATSGIVRARLGAMEKRAEVSAFQLTRASHRLAAVTLLVRRALHRALLEVWHKQTEFNRTTIEMGRDVAGELDEIRGALEEQREEVAALKRRLDSPGTSASTPNDSA